MTVEWYDLKLAEQGGHCATCPRRPGGTRFAVDHNHRTGQVRGVLCYVCNRLILGRIERYKVDPQKFADYLAKYANPKEVTNPTST